MELIWNVGDLRKALEQFDENDAVVVEIHEGERTEDLYPFYIDVIDGIKDVKGNEYKEVRFCI